MIKEDTDHSDTSSSSDDSEIDSDLDMASKYDMGNLDLRYSGHPEDDLDSFVAKFKNYAALRDYTPAKSALALATKIEGHANVFLETISDSEKDTVQKIHDLLKENFEGESWRWGVESKLLSRKQLVNESLDSYASDIMRWCRQIKKPDSEQLSIFVRGLLPSLRGFVFSKEPKTFREALDAARLGIAVQQTTECDLPRTEIKETPRESVNDVNTSLGSVASVVSNLVTRLEKLDKQTDNDTKVSFPNSKYYPLANNRPVRRSMVCYRCGRIGHGWRKCYAKFGVDGKPLN